MLSAHCAFFLNVKVPDIDEVIANISHSASLNQLRAQEVHLKS